MLTKKKIEEKAGSLDWKTTWTDQSKRHKAVEFQSCTTFGQDITINIDYEKLSEIEGEVYRKYTDFDVSEETSLWIGSDGHGKNGAPYEIEDIVKDMKEAENMILELSEGIGEIT